MTRRPGRFRVEQAGQLKLNISIIFFLIKTWATLELWMQGPLVARTSFNLPRRHIFLTLSAAPWGRPSSSLVPGSPGKVSKQQRRKLNLLSRRPRAGESSPAPCWPASARIKGWRTCWRRKRWIKWSLHSGNSILMKMDFYRGKNFNRLGLFHV